MCPDRDLLSAYLDGELEPPWRRNVEEHLVGCPACVRELERLRAVKRRLETEEEPDMVDAMVRVRNALETRAPARSRFLAVPLPVAALVAVLVLLMGAGVVFTALRSSDSSSVRFTASPTGIQQFEITGDPEDIRRILAALNQDAVDRTVTFEIPKGFQFAPFGEAELRPAVQRSAP